MKKKLNESQITNKLIYGDASKALSPNFYFEPEANTPNGLIPDSWVKEGRCEKCGRVDAVHIYPRGDELPDYMKLEKVDGKWEIIENAPF